MKLRASSKKYGERGEALRDTRGVEEIYWNSIVSARPNGLREKAETAISCRGPRPTRNKRYIPVVGTDTHMICARVARQ